MKVSSGTKLEYVLTFKQGNNMQIYVVSGDFTMGQPPGKCSFEERK